MFTSEMALQKVFVKTVHFYFPTVVPTHLESIDEFDIGKVLLFKSKPRLLMPWRAHHLQLTGYPIGQLLATGDAFTPVTTANTVFTTGPATMTRDIQFDVDVGLKEALLRLGIAADAKEDKKVTISTDLGKVTHVASNMFNLLSTAKHKVDMNHPIVKEAMSKGETLFVVSALYSSEKLMLQIQVSERAGEKAGGSKDGSTSENVTKEITSSNRKLLQASTVVGIIFLGEYTIHYKSELVGLMQSQHEMMVRRVPFHNCYHMPC